MGMQKVCLNFMKSWVGVVMLECGYIVDVMKMLT